MYTVGYGKSHDTYLEITLQHISGYIAYSWLHLIYGTAAVSCFLCGTGGVFYSKHFNSSGP